MKESKRQKQVSGLIQEEMNQIFQRLGLNMINGGMVSISTVKMTPDLLEARIYLSFFQASNPDAALKVVTDRGWEIKKELTARIRQQLRRMPELKYFRDDTLDQVFRMEELFKEISSDEKKDDKEKKQEEE